MTDPSVSLTLGRMSREVSRQVLTKRRAVDLCRMATCGCRVR